VMGTTRRPPIIAGLRVAGRVIAVTFAALSNEGGSPAAVPWFQIARVGGAE
jgi:hypothetical protein